MAVEVQVLQAPLVAALLSGQIEALAGVLLLVLAGTEALHGQDLVFRVADLVVDRTPAHRVVVSPEAQSPVHREEAQAEAVVVRQAESVAVVEPPDN